MKKISTLFILLCFPLVLLAQLCGKVIGVSDGDTFTLLTEDNRQVKIRLHGIDCPEKNQDFGQKAKQFTSDAVFGQFVCVEEKDIDRYGRTIGIVKYDGKILNEELLAAGLAWHYTKYDKSQRLAELERRARSEKAGLWIQPEAIAPWDFRHPAKAQAH
ncbi:MAG: thermonuclease family protein [Chitinophagaceae bacterium]